MQAGTCLARSMPEQSKDHVREQKHSRQIAAPAEPITVRRQDAFISLYPEGVQRLTYGIDYSDESEVIGKQWFTWAPAEDQHYRWQIAPARTFATCVQVRNGACYSVCTCKGLARCATSLNMVQKIMLPVLGLSQCSSVGRSQHVTATWLILTADHQLLAKLCGLLFCGASLQLRQLISDVNMSVDVGVNVLLIRAGCVQDAADGSSEGRHRRVCYHWLW